jgi:heterodisulfide reductase subunit C
MELMTLYFTKLRRPFVSLRYAALGLKLIRKGKLSLQLPSKGRGKLAAIFSHAETMER